MRYDLNLISIDTEGMVTYDSPNTGARAIGLIKILQIWLKLFLGNDCGGVLQAVKASKEDGADSCRTKIVAGLMMANNKILQIQRDLDISDSERFKECLLKSLDINLKIGEIKIELEFSTMAETRILIL